MKNWELVRQGYDPDKHNHFAPVNTIGNGRVCCRGFMEEQQEGIAGLGGIYMAGVFGRAAYQPWKGEGQELVNVPNFLRVKIEVNGRALILCPEHMPDYKEVLDIKTGVLTRTYTYCEEGKKLAAFEFSRFASQANTHLVGQRIEITPLIDGLHIGASLEIDPNITNLNDISSEPYPVQPGKKHCRVIHQDADTLCVEVDGPNPSCLGFAVKAGAEGTTLKREENVLRAEIKKSAGECVVLKKLIAVSNPSKTPEEALAEIWNKISETPEFTDVFSDHQKAMEEFWARADVVIDGDEETQLSLRYNILQLAQSCPKHTGLLSIGARGLTGEMYEGSVFWDTEIFMLPFFSMTDPDAAKNLLMFRYHTLPEAKAHAAANYFAGAMYGWQVNADGVEQTPQGVGAYYSIHIVADVAFAILEYWNGTGDDEFMVACGLEILIETARFWASRVILREDGFYDINAVRGPNEYDVLVNNNLYTNLMARENFLLCQRMYTRIEKCFPERLKELVGRLDFSEAEMRQWQEIGRSLILPYEKRENLWLEDDAWQRRKPLDMAKAKPTAKRIIDTTIPYEALPFYQVTKQADVLHVMKNLPWHFTKEQIQIAFDYYKSKTAFDSSLAYSMFALMAARLGRPEEAMGYFNNCINLDICNVQLNTISGLHFANFGGSWQAAIFGFGGVTVMEDHIHVAPNLPKDWHKMTFKVCYRKALLAVMVSHEKVQVELLAEGDGPVCLKLDTVEFKLVRQGDQAETKEE